MFLFLYPSYSSDEQSEQETKVRRKALRKKKGGKQESVSGGGDIRSSSPKLTSGTPAPSISESSQASINSKGGKKRSKLFFRDRSKVFHRLWRHQSTPKHAP